MAAEPCVRIFRDRVGINLSTGQRPRSTGQGGEGDCSHSLDLGDSGESGSRGRLKTVACVELNCGRRDPWIVSISQALAVGCDDALSFFVELNKFRKLLEKAEKRQQHAV